MHEVPESMTQRADHAVAGQLAPHRGDRDEPVVLVKVADGMRGPIDRSVVRRQRPAELEQGDDLAGERSEGELLAFGEVPGMCVDDKEAAEDVTVTCGQRRASVKANMGRPGDSGEPAEVLVVAGVSDEEPPVSQVVCCEELRAGARSRAISSGTPVADISRISSSLSPYLGKNRYRRTRVWSDR